MTPRRVRLTTRARPRQAKDIASPLTRRDRRAISDNPLHPANPKRASHPSTPIHTSPVNRRASVSSRQLARVH